MFISNRGNGFPRLVRSCVLSFAFNGAAIALLVLILAAPAAMAAPTTPTGDFTDNGDGTVTHRITGLTWMRCAMGQTWTGSTCSGTASTYTWDAAVALKATFAGKSDWRLPSIAELNTIVEWEASYPSINTAIFPNTPSLYSFWSVSADAYYSGSAWYVNFSNGGVSGRGNKSDTNPVRLVRGGQSLDPLSLYTPSADFIDNGDGTVTHLKTGLMWKRCAEGQTWSGTTCSGAAAGFTWSEATTLTSSSAGFSDWRLPTVNELLTIVEYHRVSAPAINTMIFPNTEISYFWSASTYARYSGYAWYVYFSDGDVSYPSKSNAYQVRLVRAGQFFGPWGFSAQTGVALNSVIASNTLIVTGIGSATPVSINGGSYSVNGGAYKTSSGTVNPNDKVTVRLNSSLNPSTTTRATLTVGSASGDLVVTTGNTIAPDSLAPSVPANLRAAAAGDNQIRLDWSAASDNIGVTAYRLYRNGVLLATLGNVISYADTGLSAGAGYTYRVAACDAADNCSGLSALATATTSTAIIQRPTTLTGDFIDNGDGTVTHKITGLTWMRCAMGQTWTGSTCSGTASTYAWNSAAALKSVFADRSDWRLPSVAELSTIVEREAFDPSINTAIFPNTPSSGFWSASADAGRSSETWYVNFNDGGVGTNYYWHDTYRVRLVRAGQSFDPLSLYTPSTDFIDNGDGTVTHLKTGLMWKRCAEGQTWSGTTCLDAAAGFTWSEATTLTSSSAGFSDWRLPTANELLTIIEYQRTAPAINTAIFPNSGSWYFWSASAYANPSSYAWGVGFNDGYVYGYGKSFAYQVRLVRAGQFFGPWGFSAQTGVALNSVITSNTLTVTGIGSATPVSISGGSYSVNGGAYTTSPGTVNLNDMITVRLNSSLNPTTATRATLTIGTVSGDFVVTTLAETQAPTAPGGLKASATSPTQIELTWDPASDNIGVTAYRLYRNGVLLAVLGNVTRYTDTQLSDATSFSYSVVACDAASNCSAPSSTASASSGGTLKTAPLVAAGTNHSAAIDNAGRLWTWGYNDAGQLGDGSTTGQRSSPHSIGTGYTLVAAGGSHTLALKADGSLWTWGANASGQLGDGGSSSRNTPQQIRTGFVVIAAGDAHSLAVNADGSLWAWGKNSSGEVGDGTANAHADPVQIGTGFYAIAAGSGHSLGLKTDGSLWAWGSNQYGQLGDGSGNDRYAPTEIGTGFSAIAAGDYHSLALKTNGSLWTWGRNDNGQLGDGTTTYVWSPVFIGGGFAALAAGAAHSVALKSDGSLWAWGANASGQLGDGTKTASPVPKYIAAGISAIAAGSNHTLALKPDGTIASWGNNGAGQLGDGTFATRSARVSVVNETVDGVLDLIPDVAYNIPKYELPPFFSIAEKTNSTVDTTVTVTNTIKINPEDLSKSGAMYITAMVPAGTLGATQSASSATRVAGATVRSVARNTSAAAVSPQCVQMQLTASGWQPVVSGQVIAAATGLLREMQAAQTIMNKTDPDVLAGAKFCVGYGASAAEMIASKRWKTVVTIPGDSSSACSAAESCIVDSNAVSLNYSLRLPPSWSLLGNSLNQTLSVASMFGDPNAVTSVWKWDAANAKWQFYTPTMDAATLQAYAAGKGYDVLREIMPGEGYWVNAKAQPSLSNQSGPGFNLVFGDLVKGWNLVATGSDVTASAFNASLKASLSGTDVVSLWAWDNQSSSWYFYAPSLDADGGLANYIAGKGYLDFTLSGKRLGNGTGFWVNRP